MDISHLASLIATHWLFCLVVAYLVGDFVVAVTPKRFQQTPWFGVVLTILHFVSLHLHADDPRGTVKIPVFNIPIVLGRSIVDASPSADVTAKIDKPGAP